MAAWDELASGGARRVGPSTGARPDRAVRAELEQRIILAEQEVGRNLSKLYARRVNVIDRHHANNPQQVMEADLIADLQEVMTRAAQKKYRDRRTFEFHLTDEEAPHAFALPGGHIFISSALLRRIETHRDETAFILGHEMGHIIQMHPVKRIVQDKDHGGSMDRLRNAAACEQWLENAGQEFLWQPYSEDRELLADKQAIRLVWAAGFDPEAPLRMFERLSASESGPTGKPLPPYFTKHPSFERRAMQVREYISSHRSGSYR